MELEVVHDQHTVDPAGTGSSGKLPTAPIATLLGFTLTTMNSGLAIIEFEATEKHTNPMGTLHGGVLAAIADAAMAMAYASTLEEGETFTTLELKINFLRPVWKGGLLAVGKVVKGGRTIGLVECDITDEKHQLIARATSTCMTLRGNQAKGR